MSWSSRSGKDREEALDAVAELAATGLRADVLGALTDAIALLRKAVPPKGSRRLARTHGEQVVVVEGRGRFPTEMCERDVCVPRREDDALRMGDRSEVRRVALRHFVREASTRPNERRWESFCWSVVYVGPEDDFAMRHNEIMTVGAPAAPTRKRTRR